MKSPTISLVSSWKMPGTVLPPLAPYVPPPPTQEKLDWADLPTIDLAKNGTPEGRAELVEDLRNALATFGFFYVINHGWTPEQTKRIFDIANVPFDEVSVEEKQKYTAKIKETGSYQGYKPRQYWHIANGVRDQLEHYNINRNVYLKQHPEPLRPFLPELSAFAKHNHYNILHPLLRLIASTLELPEDTFVDQHGFDDDAETWIRFIKYYPRSEEEEQKTNNVWLKGHKDQGTISLLWSQPISALQVQMRDGTWKWVKHVENALVVNTGESLEFLTGGHYKGTIHRVIQPPVDQRNSPRLGVFYFAMCNDAVKLVPIQGSPVLQRSGTTRHCPEDVAPTMAEWRKGRARAYGQTELTKGEEKNVEVERIHGVIVRHYS